MDSLKTVDSTQDRMHSKAGEELSNKDNKSKCLGFGIFCAILCCVFFALSSIIVKTIRDVDGIELACARFTVQFVIALPIITYRRRQVEILGPFGLRKYLWLRGVIGSSCVPLLYLSVQKMDVGDAVTISYTSMVMLPIFARILLKEKLALMEVVLGLISLAGVILIAQPKFIFSGPDSTPLDTVGVVLGLFGAVAQALSIILIRKLGKTDVILNVIYFSFNGAILTLFLAAVMGNLTLPCYEDLLKFFSLGALGIIAQGLLTLSLQYERAGTVGVTRSVQVILAYVFQVTILGKVPSTLSIAGSSLIFCSCVTLASRKVLKEHRQNKSKDDE